MRPGNPGRTSGAGKPLNLHSFAGLPRTRSTSNCRWPVGSSTSARSLQAPLLPSRTAIRRVYWNPYRTSSTPTA
jgi:hypothetical protein